MGFAQFLVRCHRLAMRDLPVESHDRPERLVLRDEPKLSRSEVIALALIPHLLLFDRLDVLLEQILNTEFHNEVPDVLPVVKDSRVLLLLLSGIKVAPDLGHEDILEDPFHEPPPYKFILPLEILGVLMVRIILHPPDVVDRELVKHRDLRKSLIPIKLHELRNLMVELFFISGASLQKEVWENMVGKLLQILGHLTVRGMALLEKLKEHFAPGFRVLGLLNQLLPPLFPIWRQRRILF